MRKIIFFVIILMQCHVFLLYPGCFFRNIDGSEVAITVKDQKNKTVMKSTLLKPNEEIFFSDYYLRLLGVIALKAFFGGVNTIKNHKLIVNVNYDSDNKDVYNIHGIEDYALCDIAVLRNKSKKIRTITPRKFILPGYYLRNIDECNLKVILSNYQEQLKEIVFLPNQEIFIDPAYLRDKKIYKLTVTFDAFGKKYSTDVQSPLKQFKYQKVYNICRGISVFGTKHRSSNDTKYTVCKPTTTANYEEFCKLIKQFDYQELYKLLKHLGIFDEKHIHNSNDTEFVAIPKSPTITNYEEFYELIKQFDQLEDDEKTDRILEFLSISFGKRELPITTNYEGFYERTGLDKLRGKAQSILDLTNETPRPSSAHPAESL